MTSDGKRRAVLVTGATGGIGGGLVRALAERGYAVFAAVRKDDGGLAELPGVAVVPLDVADPASVDRAAERVGAHPAAEHGLYAVVNNAGVIVQGPLELVPPEELRRQFDVNALGPAYVTRSFLPLLRAGGGRIVNVTAPSARMGFPHLAPLSASKAALDRLSESLRIELAPWGIPVALVEPGATDTAIFARAAAAADVAQGAADPGRVALYEPQLAAFAKTAERQRNRPVDGVVRTLVTALEARRPKRRYRAGRDVWAVAALSRWPAGPRQSAVARAFGLAGIAPGAARAAV